MLRSTRPCTFVAVLSLRLPATRRRRSFATRVFRVGECPDDDIAYHTAYTVIADGGKWSVRDGWVAKLCQTACLLLPVSSREMTEDGWPIGNDRTMSIDRPTDRSSDWLACRPVSD